MIVIIFLARNIMVLAVFTRCFKNLGQKWAKNGPKRGLKMAKFQNLFFIDFLAQNYLKKWYQPFSHDVWFQSYEILCNFGVKMGLKRPKNGQISETILSSFFWLETTSKNGTSHFHTMFGSRGMHFLSFWGKIRIFGSKFQPNQRNYS